MADLPNGESDVLVHPGHFKDMEASSNVKSWLFRHIVQKDKVNYYLDQYSPKILRDLKRTNVHGLHAINFGVAKGHHFDRVLIFRNGPIKKYLENADPHALKELTKAKFYVALTRVSHNVAFVRNNNTCFSEIQRLYFN